MLPNFSGCMSFSTKYIPLDEIIKIINNIKKAAPNDFLWSHKTTKRVLIELEYLENLRSRKILNALTNLKSTVGNKKANKLGRIATASIRAEKLNMYFILALELVSFLPLFSIHDHNLPMYSIEKIVTEKNSKYLKKVFTII